MKLEYLKLTNFRGFRELEISFDPSFTVLLGGNMAGKSAVLEAAAFVLSRLLGTTQARDIEDDEVYQVAVISGGVPALQLQFPVAVEARIADEGFSGGRDVWHLYREASDGPTRIENAPYTLLNSPINEDLPIIAQYGAQRHWDRKQTADDLKGIASRYDGYAGAFDIRSTHALMAGWMRRQTYIEVQQAQQGNGYVHPQLAAVNAAVKSCIDGVTRFWFDIMFDDLRLERSGGDLQSFAMLSEGYRNMVAMVADIAWRASVLNPHHGPEAHLRTEGVVLLDELDLHLHPEWQRRIVGDLRRTFPKVQFIVTTHSPQIVASVTRDQVRLLDRNQLVTGKPYVEGRDSSEILEDVFGVPSRPEPVKAQISELYQLIEDAKFAEARLHLARLEERLGPDDTAMVRARWILDTEDAESNVSPTSPT